MSSLLVKIPILLSGAYFHQQSITPPGIEPDQKETLRFAHNESVFHRTLLRRTRGPLKTIGWLAALCESAVIFVHIYPFHQLFTLVTSSLASIMGNIVFTSHITISPECILGWVFLAIGWYIRATCYRYLGKFFTFDLAIRKDHQLITTGPYAIVRHPSYTGLIMVYIGYVLVLMGRGSLLAACMWDSLAWRGLGITIAAYRAYQIVTFVVRVHREDAVLREVFGSRWDEWAKSTSYRLLPGLY